MIQILLIAPLALCLVILYIKKMCSLHVYFTILYAVLHLTASIYLLKNPEVFAPYFEVDRLNGLFLLILSIVFLSVAVYDIDFFSHKGESKHPERSWKYHIFLLLFVDSMNGVLLSTHIGVLWVFLEAATLFSAVLIYYYTGKEALEATWKYIFICSIGISFAFIGIILLSIGCIHGEIALFWDALDMNAKSIDPFWLKLSFPFLLLGFGTKMGLAPMHNWLPDAYAEAPAPAAALISATLVNTAFLAILRVHNVMLHAELGKYSSTLLLIMGFLSLLVSAVFILRAKNYKRMLAYSSVENMGIVAIGLGLGGAGIFAALIQMLGHSLVKAAFFLTSGNVFHIYRTKRINSVHGMWRVSPGNAWLFIACFAGICAFPPFVSFISELLILRELMGRSVILTVIFCVLLTVIIFGMARCIISMVSGSSSSAGVDIDNIPDCSIFGYVSQWTLIAFAALFGVFMPAGMIKLVEQAARFIGD